MLSLDLRIQYLAYRELKSAILENRAHAGSVVVIDIDTGEVLAMVNQPAYNPNDRAQLQPATYRNRAVTDLFEPGSSIKPFVVAAGLASGKFSTSSVIDTNPGFIQVGATTFQDEHNLGAVPLATVLAKSSNVGMAKLALQLEPQQIWEHARIISASVRSPAAAFRVSRPACSATTRIGARSASRLCRMATASR